MAHEDPKVPSIGQTIDDEQPSRAKQFFTNPKNLATMLVLASALAQPKRSGRSDLAHGLRGGVGALAFRGGLDQQIHLQAQEDEEQQSVIEGRLAAQATQEAQVQAINRRTDVTAETAEAQIESAEEISALDRAAGKFAKAPPASGTFLERAFLEAQKNYSDAYAAWVGFGSQGPPPKYEEFILRAMQGAALLGLGPASQIDFTPITELPDSADEATIPGGVPTPRQVRQLSPREESKVGRSSVAQHFIGKGIVDDTLEAKLLRNKMPVFRDIKEDSGVVSAARQIDAQVQQQLSTMTIEEAKAAIKERRWALSDETIAALRNRIAELTPIKTPTAPLTEALGGLARRP